jgi:hypothetical protein
VSRAEVALLGGGMGFSVIEELEAEFGEVFVESEVFGAV